MRCCRWSTAPGLVAWADRTPLNEPRRSRWSLGCRSARTAAGLTEFPLGDSWRADLGRDAALKRFETLYQGAWKLSPDTANLKAVMVNDMTAQIHGPITFNIGPPGQPAPDALFLMNQTLVKTAAGWRIASILPIPLPQPAAVPPK